MIKRRESKVKPSIILILFRHGLHGSHGSIRLNPCNPCNPCLNESHKSLLTHLTLYFCAILFLAAISFRFSGEDSQFKNSKDDFCCGISGKCIF